MTNTHWPTVITEAVRIADSYSFAPTLRQVFYRLVAGSLIPNNQSSYKRLSHLTAIERREGRMSPLADGTRSIDRPADFASPFAALRWLADRYRIDRTEGQERQMWVVLEKATLTALAREVAFPLGVPIAALRGYGSQTLVDDVADEIDADGRPAEVVYVGDFDPSGLDISRDLLDRLGVDVTFTRVAVNREQITEYDLATVPAKRTDSRTARMLAEQGVAVQVEAEAIEPAELQRLISDALEARLDRDVYDATMKREKRERAVIAALRLPHI